MNILITGGCGFIGVNLIARLLDRDGECRIRVVDNLSVGSREDLAAVAEFVEIGQDQMGEAPGYRLELAAGDIRDESLAAASCRGADAVVHLAASTGVIPSIENPRADCLVNVMGTLNFLEAARSNGVRRFVFASSGAPLGDQEPPIHEELAPHPLSPYGAGKLAGEAYCAAYEGSFGLETVALRFGNVYGPRSSHKNSVVAKFIKHILGSEPLPIYGDGNQSRDFIYTDDLVRAILLAVESPGIGGQMFQIATHREHTVLEVAGELNRLAEKHLGRTSPVVFEGERKGEIRRSYSDISKARKVLGFEPGYDLKAGLEATFLWFLSQSKQQAEDMH